MVNQQTQFYEHALSVQEYVDSDINEATTRHYLVDPVLRILGYTAIRDVKREVPVPETKEFIDYELLLDGRPFAIVEAKRVKRGVLEQDAGQCVQYASVLGVRWCLITNGLRWALYDGFAPGSLAAKRIAEVDIGVSEEQTANAWRILWLFSKEAQARADPLVDLLVERVILDELSRPDSPAVDALRRAVATRFRERVTSSVVLGVLKRLGTSLPVSAVPVVVPPPPKPGNSGGGRPARQPASGILSALIDAGLLPDGSTLEARYHGVSHVGVIKNRGIEVEGIWYASPSAASMGIRPGVPSWNGWVDWRYRGETLDQIRKRFQMGQASPSESTPS